MKSRSFDSDRAVAILDETLGYRFKDIGRLHRALIHRSYAAENRLAFSYERLEFLGDAVLQLAVTHYIFVAYPDLAEGQMAKIRAGVVSEAALAAVGRQLGIGELVLLGRGESHTGGAGKDSILADVVESLVGALYLEVGLDRAAEIVVSHWGSMIDEKSSAPGHADYKTRLQEELAKEDLTPTYLTHEEGPEHAKRFTADVVAGERHLGVGSGSSKKRAEQEAARAAVTAIEDCSAGAS